MIKSIYSCLILLSFISVAHAKVPSIDAIPDDLNATQFKNPIFAIPMKPYSTMAGNLLLTPTQIIYVDSKNFNPCHILKQNETAVLMECDAYDPALPLDKSKINKNQKPVFKEWNLFVSVGKEYPSAKSCRVIHYYDNFLNNGKIKPFSDGASYIFQAVEQEDCGPTQDLSF